MSENKRNYFFWHESSFTDAVKKRVCPLCDHYNENGPCRTPDPQGCALFRHLPQLVIIAQHLTKPDLKRYVAQVGEHVKMDCAHPGGGCPFRDTLECGMKEYLPYVLEAVWKTDKSLEERPWFQMSA